MLTGEVGTGKTTLCRNLLADLPDNVDVALILNPNINRRELLETVCDELKIQYPEKQSKKKLLDSINQHLLNTFAENKHTVLIIDEAQLLSHTVLEQVRLLTNLETTKSKLLQIILIGQPELSEVLARNDLRQLSQRVTARYHLPAIGVDEIQDYVNFRLGVAGCKKPLFSAQALKLLHQLSGGIPRKINVLADNALLSTYAKSELLVNSATLKQSAKDVFIKDESVSHSSGPWPITGWLAIVAAIILLNVGLWWWFAGGGNSTIGQLSSDSRTEQSLLDRSTDNIEVTDAAPNGDTVLNAENSNKQLGMNEAPEAENAALKPSLPDSAAQDTTVVENIKPSIDLSALAKSDASLTTPEELKNVTPGSVVISQEYLDDSASDLLADGPQQLGSPEPVKPQQPVYLRNSVFGRVLEVSSDRTGRVAAFRNLASAWDANLPKPLLGPLCDELTNEGVMCVPVSSWSTILRLNRPTIMVLSHRNQNHRVIFYKLSGGIASVLVGDQSYDLSVSELQDRWSNNAMVFWRPSALGEQFLQLGDNSPLVGALRDSLNQLFSEIGMPQLSSDVPTLYDAKLAARVSELQRRFNITADGKVGRETYLLINELLNSQNVPVLRIRR